MHVTKQGGFLNIHSDFSAHPYNTNWKRQITLLLYLNDDWDESYGGQLEFWSANMERCIKKINPILNRCVIFHSGPNSNHGYPDPLDCPKHMLRKSIALYYYTVEKEDFIYNTTEYKARPLDKMKMMFRVDNFLLKVYAVLKRKLKFTDRLLSKILHFFN